MGGHGYKGVIQLLLSSLLFHNLLAGFRGLWVADQTLLIHYSAVNFLTIQYVCMYVCMYVYVLLLLYCGPE
jgi:hypothetical protein